MLREVATRAGHGRGRRQPRLTRRGRDRVLGPSEWDKFLSPEPPLDDPVPVAESRTSADVPTAVPDLVVILEALLDVKDIALSDADEVAHLRSALSGVDRSTSIATWPRAEPYAMMEWREGVLSRAAQSDVAAAILHALEPYHVLIRKAHPARPVVIARLSADRVTAVRQGAGMRAWSDQMEQIVTSDGVELGEWLRYWITVRSSAGTQEDTVTWLRKVAARAQAGSEGAVRVMESIRQRDQTLAALSAAAARAAVFVVRVPRAAPRPAHRASVNHVE